MAINRKNFNNANLVDKEWRQGLINFDTINSNYAIVRQYYHLRRKAFLIYWQNVLNLKKEQDVEKILTLASDATQDYYHHVLDLWNYAYAYANQIFPGDQNKEVRKRYIKLAFSWEAQRLGYNIGGYSLDDFIRNKTNSTFYEVMGFQSEEIMAQNVNAYSSKISNSLVNSLTANVTGKKGLNLFSKSGVVSKSASTKADVLIYPSSISITQDQDGNAAYSDGNNPPLNMEILTAFDVQTNSGNYDEATLLSTYAQYYNGNLAGVGGISQKTYSLSKAISKSSAKFAVSEPIKQQLDSLYRGANYSTGYLTQDFVDTYTIYHISKQLMTLISPTTIAFVDNEDFFWMDDLLDQVFFTMRAISGKEQKSSSKREINKIQDKTERKKALQKYSRLKGKNLAYRWYRFSMDPSAEVRMYSKNRTNIAFMQRIQKAYEEKTGNEFIGFEQKTLQSQNFML